MSRSGAEWDECRGRDIIFLAHAPPHDPVIRCTVGSKLNRVPEPRFPVGALVRLVSDQGILPEGLSLGFGMDVVSEDLADGDIGIVVNKPCSQYTPCVAQDEITSWVLVRGSLLEVPHFHMRRVRCPVGSRGKAS